MSTYLYLGAVLNVFKCLLKASDWTFSTRIKPLLDEPIHLLYIDVDPPLGTCELRSRKPAI